jgi:hypothetical protein
MIVACGVSYGCGGPDCDAPEYGSCTRDSEHHRARELRFMAWLSGHWRATDSAGRVHEERWSPPTGGIMLGVARSHHDGRDLSSEIMRIEVRRTGITYSAHPEAQMPGTSFRLYDIPLARRGELRFANPDHDFPTRIMYRRTGPDEMLVRVENDDEGFTRQYARVDVAPGEEDE